MMSVNDKNDYHRIIREMIKNEDEVRNSRNNWFMALQGLLVNAFIGPLVLHQKDLMFSTETIKYIVTAIALMGVITSISFLHAAWRSKKSVMMALACWDLFLTNNTHKIQDYPPVTLITEGIIGKNAKDNIIGAKDWENDVNKMMYGDNDCLKCCDKKKNKLDILMPFQLVPFVFIVFWIISIIFIWIQN